MICTRITFKLKTIKKLKEEQDKDFEHRYRLGTLIVDF